MKSKERTEERKNSMFIPFIDTDKHYMYFIWSQVTDEYFSPHYLQEIPVF
jgi:hypothetical protein